MVAAGVTFYTLLAIFPGLAAFVSLYGLFSDVTQVPGHLRLAAYVLPADSLTFIGREMVRLATARKGGLSLAFALAVATSIWSANGAVKALMSGLNAAYEEQEGRSFLRQTAVSLLFTLGFILFGLAATAALSAGPVVAARLGPKAASVFNLAVYPALLVALVVALALLYRFGPSRRHCRIAWFSWGAVAAIGLWLLISALFQVYVGNFAHYDRVYGSFGAVVGFIVWLYLSNNIVLLGAELNAELEGPTRGRRPAVSPWRRITGP
jgi:membrane protein